MNFKVNFLARGFYYTWKEIIEQIRSPGIKRHQIQKSAEDFIIIIIIIFYTLEKNWVPNLGTLLALAAHDRFRL